MLSSTDSRNGRWAPAWELFSVEGTCESVGALCSRLPPLLALPVLTLLVFLGQQKPELGTVRPSERNKIMEVRARKDLRDHLVRLFKKLFFSSSIFKKL